jgi:serine/threonine protein kinase
MIGQLAVGMYVLHKNEIIHRDLKLKDIMVDKYGDLKIGIFIFIKYIHFIFFLFLIFRTSWIKEGSYVNYYLS